MNSNSKRICRLICLWFAVCATGAAPFPADNPAPSRVPREYSLRLNHTHTNESINVVYKRGESYVPEALTLLSHHLRDHVSGEVMDFDPRLFDLLADLAELVGHPGGKIEVICGYRSQATNDWLRKHSSGVASHSLHLQAMAIDIRMPGVKTSALRDAALSLQRGGVGYYPGSNFVHVDVGPVRRW